MDKERRGILTSKRTSVLYTSSRPSQRRKEDARGEDFMAVGWIASIDTKLCAADQLDRARSMILFSMSMSRTVPRL